MESRPSRTRRCAVRGPVRLLPPIASAGSTSICRGTALALAYSTSGRRGPAINTPQTGPRLASGRSCYRRLNPGCRSHSCSSALEYGRSRAGRDRQTYVCAEHFGRLSTLGWTDVWRHHIPGITEYTWYSNLKGGARGNGFSSQILRMPSAYTCDWLPISNTSS